MERTYVETAKGERYFDDVARISDGRVYRQTAYSDGGKSANVMYDGKDVSSISRIGVGHEFMGETRMDIKTAPEPFRYTRVGLIPLYEALHHAEKLERVDAIGRACDRYLFREVKSAGKPQSMVYALDRVTSVPLMVAAYKDIDHVHAELPYWAWEAVTLDTVSGYHFPLKSKYSSSSDLQWRPGDFPARHDAVDRGQDHRVRRRVSVVDILAQGPGRRHGP